MLPLFLLFVVVPITEIALFIWVGSRIGLGATIAIVILTALAGSALVARQGSGAVQQVQDAIFQARIPVRELAHGFMIAVAGVLLITPGFLTDAVGFLLLVPPVREAVRIRLGRRFRGRWVVRSGPAATDAHWSAPEPPGQDPTEPPDALP